MFVVSPLLEYAGWLATALVEALGIQETPSNLELVLGVVGVGVVYSAWKDWGPKNGGSWSQVCKNLSILLFYCIYAYSLLFVFLKP